jgi:hypothetical protein
LVYLSLQFALFHRKLGCASIFGLPEATLKASAKTTFLAVSESLERVPAFETKC